MICNTAASSYGFSPDYARVLFAEVVLLHTGVAHGMRVAGSKGSLYLQSENYRVLLLNWRDIQNPLAGGAEVHIWEVFSRLASAGWDVEALCASFPGAEREVRLQGISVTRIAHPAVYHWALPWAYQRAERRFKPHIVIDFMNKLPLYSPLFVKEPLCCFVHHLFGSSAIREAGILAGACILIYEWPMPRIYRNTPFLTGSGSSIQELKALGLRCVEDDPMPYGVDTRQFMPGAKSCSPTILYLGRLKRYKGVNHIIGLMPWLCERIPEVRLVIAGTGDARKLLEKQVDRLGLRDTVSFPGFVTEEDRLRLFQEAWVTCLPSYKEGFGLTIPEAALCETPTVGYDVPGLRDAIDHEKMGLLVSYGDRGALGTALLTVLTDSALQRDLGQAARMKYLDFTWDNAALRMDHYLKTFIERQERIHD